jgi:hypothetical protein
MHALQKVLPETVRFAPHYFGSLDALPFDGIAYSQMKFGSDKIARLFGYEMADVVFADPTMKAILAGPCVAVSAPATTVPIAATMLLAHFLNRLNSLLDQAGMEPVEWTHVHRNFGFNDTYASADYKERMAALSADDTFINHRYVEGKTIIWVDDVVVTGAHEHRMENFIRGEGLDNPLVFVAYARYTGNEPSTEMTLNHYSIKDAWDILMISGQKGFRVTTRSIRLILKQSPEDFDLFVDRAERAYLEDLYNCAIVKRYSVHEDYLRNFAILRKIVTGA